MEKKNITFQCPNCGETLSIEARLVSNEKTASSASAHVNHWDRAADGPSAPVTVKPSGKGGKFTKAEFKSTKARQRLEALKAAGINVSNYMVATGVSGNETIMRVTERGPEFVSDDDAIFNAIIAGGTVYDPRLFRRWVLSQTFEALQSHGGFTEWLKQKGYEYQFKMTAHELSLQSKIRLKDKQNFQVHNKWFNKEIVNALCIYDYNNILDHVNSLKVRHCKGKPYKRINKGFGDIFVVDLEKKLFHPMIKALTAVQNAKYASELAMAFASYCSVRIPLSWNTKQCPVWVDAYKGIGAYYSMENLIKFHGCKYNAKVANQHESFSLALLAIDNCTHARNHEGYKMHGILKEMLKFNHIDIDRKRAEWRKAKLRK